MAATIIFDQTGLPAGTPGARTDGLDNGATVTVRNESGRPCSVALLWVPPEDTTALGSLTQVAGDTWEFDPTPSTYGEYRVELVEDLGTPNETRTTKVFGIRTPVAGLLVPGHNTGGDRRVTLQSTVAEKTAAQAITDNDEPFLGLRWLGWWKAFRDLVLFVEQLAGGFAGTPPTELWVNGATGDDNNPGTLASPIATLTEAWRRIGTRVRASCVVNIMASGTYDASAFSVRRDFGPYLVDFIAAPATATVVDTGTVTSATYQQVTAAAESWTVDAYAGLTFRVTSGAMVGEARTIIANAATTALLSDGFPVTLSAGNTFSVVRPGVILSFPAYGVLQGDSRAYVSIQGCELSWPDNSALYMVGLTYFVGVTALAGSTTNSKWIQGNGGAPYCSYANGFGWRRNGTVPAGEISINTIADFTLAGRLGRVLLNNCSGVGHSAGVSILGRLTLDSTSSDLAVGLQGWGGNYPEVLLDDLEGAVSQGPFWMLGGRGEINGPMRLEGSGAAAERFALRDQAFVELTRAAAAGYIDIALGSQLRIASGNDGGFDAVFVDGVDALTATPVAVTFGASGDAYIDESVARRD